MPDAALNFWDASWDLQEDQCPCDVHFVEWLDQSGITDSTIFHFGTGSHHYVGVECSSPKRRNSVLGITAAPVEHERFIELVIRRPDVLRFYNVAFGDIYLLNAKLLPNFDVVTLFHLCEFRTEANDTYGGLTDLEVANLLTRQTRPAGYILFYTGSFAYGPNHPIDARTVIAAWERENDVQKVGEFKTLLVYRTRAPSEQVRGRD